MTKKFIFFISAIVLLGSAWSQNKGLFKLTDTNVEVGQKFVAEIQFNFDGGQPYFKEYQPVVDSMATFILQHPNLLFELVNHVDSRGSDGYNEQMSERRAQRVLDSLISQGVPRNQVIAVGKGESEPRILETDYKGQSSGFIFPKGTVLTDEYINTLKDNPDKFEDAYRLNRRTELRVTEKK